MKRKLAQSLPLFGTFLALIIGGAVLFKFTPADAVLDAQAADVPPVDAAVDAEPIPNAESGGLVDPVINEEFVLDSAMNTASSDKVTGKEIHGIYAEANNDIILADHYLNDVYVAGSNITITGTVDGDVFAAGEHIVIEGTVMGSVRAAGDTVSVNGAVGRNVMVFASTLHIGAHAHIGEDVMMGVGQGEIDAMVMGNVTGTAGQLEIDSVVEGEVNLLGIDHLMFGPNAYVMGNVNYTSDQTATIDAEATLLKDTHYTKRIAKDNGPSVAARTFHAGFKLAMIIISWLGFLLLGIVLLKLMPKMSNNVVMYMHTKPVQSLGYGALMFIFPPVVLIFIALTVIGLPLAITGGLTYLLLLIISKVFAGLAVGKLLLKNTKSLVGPFVLGFTLLAVVHAVLSLLGLVGMIISSLLAGLIFTWALGALVKSCHHGRNL